MPNPRSRRWVTGAAGSKEGAEKKYPE